MAKIDHSKAFTRKVIVVALMAVVAAGASAQEVSVTKGRLHLGDDKSWAKPDMDDASWSEVDITKLWDKQGFPQNTNAYGWYRIHVTIPKACFRALTSRTRLSSTCRRLMMWTSAS